MGRKKDNDGYGSGEYIRESTEYRREGREGLPTEGAEAKFRNDLQDGEFIIWTGSREKGAKLSELEVPFAGVLMSLIFIASGLLVMIAAWSEIGAQALVGLAFVIPGLIILRILFGSRKMTYVLTNRRLLSYDGRELTRIDLSDIIEVKFTESNRHIGTVTYKIAWYGPHSNVFRTMTGIKQPKEAAEKLNAAIKNHNKR